MGYEWPNKEFMAPLAHDNRLPFTRLYRTACLESSKHLQQMCLSFWCAV